MGKVLKRMVQNDRCRGILSNNDVFCAFFLTASLSSTLEAVVFQSTIYTLYYDTNNDVAEVGSKNRIILNPQTLIQWLTKHNVFSVSANHNGKSDHIGKIQTWNCPERKILLKIITIILFLMTILPQMKS